MENQPPPFGVKPPLMIEPTQGERVSMKTRLFLVCCAPIILGSGCATSDSGATADQSGTVSGSSYREFYYADPEHPQYYSRDPWIASQPAYREYNYVDPHKDYFGARPATPVWKQPSPSGQDWVDPRPEFLWFR